MVRCRHPPSPFHYSMGPVVAQSTEGARNADRANYRSAFPATDLEFQATEAGLKETLTLHSAAARNVFTYALTGPVTGITPAKDGSLILNGPGSKPVMRLDAPWAQEQPTGNTVTPMLGSQRHASLSAEKGDVRLRHHAHGRQGVVGLGKLSGDRGPDSDDPAL